MAIVSQLVIRYFEVSAEVRKDVGVVDQQTCFSDFLLLQKSLYINWENQMFCASSRGVFKSFD